MFNSPIQRRTIERLAPAGTLACSRPVRVGILIDSLRPPHWVKQIMDDIRACTPLSATVLVVQPGPRRNGSHKATKGNTLLRLWAHLDNFLRANEKSAMAPVAINAADYGNLVTIGSSDPFKRNEIARIRQLDLDVIVNLANLSAAEELAPLARRGVWNYAGFDGLLHQDHANFFWKQRSSPVVADEIVERADGVERVVHRAFVASDPESPYRARNGLLWRRSGFLVQRLCSLADEQVREPRVQCAAPLPLSAPQSQDSGLTNLQTARLLAGVLAGGLGRMVRRQVKTEHWFIAVRESSGVPVNKLDMRGFRAIRAPRHRYYADPFAIEVGGRQYVFMEDFREDEGKAVISYFLYDGSEHVNASVAVETAYHLSYPFLFRWNGEIFMMPETSSARRVEVFRAVDFPNRWEHHAVLIDDVVAYDPTMVAYGGKFWLFLSGVLRYGAQNNDLSIFYADTPLGPWRPHPGNPVVSDPRRARPAGAVFCHGGRLYRPGQDCWASYGRAITISRIEELSETQFRETPVGRIEPDWLPGITGTHTFNDNGRIQVIDGRVLALRWGRSNY